MKDFIRFMIYENLIGLLTFVIWTFLTYYITGHSSNVFAYMIGWNIMSIVLNFAEIKSFFKK